MDSYGVELVGFCVICVAEDLCFVVNGITNITRSYINKWRTVSGPGRVITTCSVYVPGYMKIVVEELSFGRELTAPETVWNSPEVVVPARTITDPAEGWVREAAETCGKR